jgi:predicted kinase
MYPHLQSLVPAPGQSADWPALLAAYPALRALAATPQDPVYHAEGNVEIHTRMVLDALCDSADYRAAGDDERFILFHAAVLHDVAKPDTTVVDPDTGRIGQPGHSRRGSIDARIALWRAGVPLQTREAVCRIIAVHQVPFHALGTNRAGHAPEFIIRRLSWELDLHLLAAMAEADMRGRECVSKADSLSDIELFRELAREENCYRQPRAFADDHTRIAYFGGASVHPDYALHHDPGAEVVVMCGLPASGKNTWVDQHCPQLPVVSFDDAREELGLAHGKNEGAVAHRAVDKAKELLRARRPFVFNATHLSGQMRKKTLDLVHNYGARARVVYLEAAPDVVFERNRRRDTSLTNQAIERMLFKWEVPTPAEAEMVEYWETDGAGAARPSSRPTSSAPTTATIRSPAPVPRTR